MSTRFATARRGPRSRALIGWLLKTAAVAGGLAVGSTLAFFSANTVFSGGGMQAGDLNISVGNMTWKQVTPGVSGGASGTLSATPESFLSMPGDVIEIRVPVTTYLRGDNLKADLVVGYESPDAAAGKIAASFVILNGSGTQVAPASGAAAANASSSVAGLAGTNNGSIASWTVVLTVTVLGDYQWATPQSAPAVEWNAGHVLAQLHQVRPGVGGAP